MLPLAEDFSDVHALPTPLFVDAPVRVLESACIVSCLCRIKDIVDVLHVFYIVHKLGLPSSVGAELGAECAQILQVMKFDRTKLCCV